MAVVNGTSSASALLALQMKIQTALGTNKSIMRLYDNEKPVVAMAMMEAQVSKVEFSKEKEQTLQISWFDQVKGSVGTSITTDCAFTGALGGTEVQSYALDAYISSTFSSNDKVQRTNMIDQSDEIPVLLLQHMHLHAMEVNNRVIAFLEANYGTAVVTGTGLSNNVGGGIDVPGASYNDTLMSKLVRLSVLNNINGGLTITGGSFFDAYFNAEKKFANADGKDNKNRLDVLDWVFDLYGLGADADEPIYMASPFVYAIANKTRNLFPEGTPRVGGTSDRVFYTLRNPFLPGLVHEVTERYVCLDNAMETTHFAINTWVKPFLHPKSTNALTNTGIIKLQKT